jgi:hypothetical protein
MTELKEIPEEVRWRLAAEFAARLPAIYEAAFRPLVGEKYDGIEQEVWMELSRTAVEIARYLSLPVGNAKQLAGTMRIVLVILFGPGFSSEALEVAPDRSVIIMKRCPLIDQGSVEGLPVHPAFRKCMAFTLTAVPLLNKNYSARFVRTMCSGDRQCEIKIAEAQEPPADAKKKK